MLISKEHCNSSELCYLNKLLNYPSKEKQNVVINNYGDVLVNATLNYMEAVKINRFRKRSLMGNWERFSMWSVSSYI